MISSLISGALGRVSKERDEAALITIINENVYCNNLYTHFFAE